MFVRVLALVVYGCVLCEGFGVLLSCMFVCSCAYVYMPAEVYFFVCVWGPIAIDIELEFQKIHSAVIPREYRASKNEHDPARERWRKGEIERETRTCIHLP